MRTAIFFGLLIIGSEVGDGLKPGLTEFCIALAVVFMVMDVADWVKGFIGREITTRMDQPIVDFMNILIKQFKDPKETRLDKALNRFFEGLGLHNINIGRTISHFQEEARKQRIVEKNHFRKEKLVYYMKLREKGTELTASQKEDEDFYKFLFEIDESK